MTGRSRKKLLVACVALAAGAFLADRLWPTSQPAKTAAADAKDAVLVTPAGEPTSRTEPKVRPRRGTYGPRVPAMRTDMTPKLDRDPFQLIPEAFGWMSLIEQGQDAAGKLTGPGQAPEFPGPQEFAQQHGLQATCTGRRADWAMVDGRLMTVGEELDGYVLKAIERYQVTFCRGRQSAELWLPDNP